MKKYYVIKAEILIKAVSQKCIKFDCVKKCYFRELRLITNNPFISVYELYELLNFKTVS